MVEMGGWGGDEYEMYLTKAAQRKKAIKLLKMADDASPSKSRGRPKGAKNTALGTTKHKDKRYFKSKSHAIKKDIIHKYMLAILKDEKLLIDMDDADEEFVFFKNQVITQKFNEAECTQLEKLSTKLELSCGCGYSTCTRKQNGKSKKTSWVKCLSCLKWACRTCFNKSGKDNVANEFCCEACTEACRNKK